MDEESSMIDSKNNVNIYDNCIKDEVNDSMDSVNAVMNYHHSTNEIVPYINGGSQHNWSLPIETVIVEDDEALKDVRTDDDEQIADKDSYTSSNRLNNRKLSNGSLFFDFVLATMIG